MITTTRTNASRTADAVADATGGNFKIPAQRPDRPAAVPVSPDHLTEEARRRSEAEQLAIDIAAGW